MTIKFDHSQYALDADMALGASSNVITKQGPFTDQEFFRSLINPGFDGSLRYLMASCAASLVGSNVAIAQVNASSNKFCGTGADDVTVGTVSWTNPTNIYALDTTYATCILDTNQSHYLKATNFGFSLPSNAVVTGVTAKLRCKSVGGQATWISIVSARLVKGGSIVGDDKTGSYPPVIEGDLIVGSSVDMWSTALTYSDINASNFGVVISMKNISTAVTVYVNAIDLTVNYYLPAIPSVPTTVTYKWQAREIGQAWTDLLSGSLVIANTGSIADDIIKDAVATTFDAVPIDFRLIMSCADAISVAATIGNTSIRARLIGESL